MSLEDRPHANNQPWTVGSTRPRRAWNVEDPLIDLWAIFHEDLTPINTLFIRRVTVLDVHEDENIEEETQTEGGERGEQEVTEAADDAYQHR